MPFICPTCGCHFFDQLITRRPNGRPRRTELFFCLGCTAVFLEPELFTAAPQFSQAQQLPPTPTVGDLAIVQRSLSRRYWAARAKRERGGVDASADDVRQLKSQLGAA